VCTCKNNVGNMISNRGLYCVWLETRGGGITRLVSLWIDPLMKAFEAHDVLPEAEISANPAHFSDDEPPSWNILHDRAIVVSAHSMKNLN
jgi:hypothetical protein